MKKFAWLLLSCVMVLSLVIASCGDTVTEEKDKETNKVETEQEKQKETETEQEQVADTGPSDEKPQYGGTINIAMERDITSWANVLEFC